MPTLASAGASTGTVRAAAAAFTAKPVVAAAAAAGPSAPPSPGGRDTSLALRYTAKPAGLSRMHLTGTASSRASTGGVPRERAGSDAPADDAGWSSDV